MMIGQPCPFCEQQGRFESSPNPVDQQMAKAFKFRKSIIALALDRRMPELGFKKFRVPSNVYDFLVTSLNDPYARVDWADPNNGYDLLLLRQGTGQNDTRYQARFAPQPSPISAHYEQLVQWVNTAPRLSGEGVVSSYEAIVARMANVAQTGRAGTPSYGMAPGAMGPGGMGMPVGAAPQQWSLQPPPMPQPEQTSVVASNGHVNQQQRPY
jgi:hypothetical protein